MGQGVHLALHIPPFWHLAWLIVLLKVLIHDLYNYNLCSY